MKYYLGIDIGATKTAALIADENGNTIGTGQGGPGNHETVGFDGMERALCESTEAALSAAKLRAEHIAGAGFGIAGYDWASEEPYMRATIDKLGLSAPYKMVNDVLLGLLAETPNVHWRTPHGEYHLRGGHRLWTAPENPFYTCPEDR